MLKRWIWIGLAAGSDRFGLTLCGVRPSFKLNLKLGLTPRPAGVLPGENRLTLQGHGLWFGKEWRVYW